MLSEYVLSGVPYPYLIYIKFYVELELPSAELRMKNDDFDCDKRYRAQNSSVAERSIDMSTGTTLLAMDKSVSRTKVSVDFFVPHFLRKYRRDHRDCFKYKVLANYQVGKRSRYHLKRDG